MAKLLTLLFEVTALFDMQTRIELVLLQKTMVVVEGVARKLDPHLDMWATAEPVVGGWIAENLGPRGRIEDLGRSVSQLARLFADAPPRLERLSRLIEREAEATPAEAPSAPAVGRWPRDDRAALWMIAAALAWIVFAEPSTTCTVTGMRRIASCG